MPLPLVSSKRTSNTLANHDTTQSIPQVAPEKVRLRNRRNVQKTRLQCRAGINTGFSTPVFRLTRQGKDNSFSRDGLRRGSPCFWPRSITDNSRQIAFVITTQMILG